MAHRRRRHRSLRLGKPGALEPLKAKDPLHTPQSVRVLGYSPTAFKETTCTSTESIRAFAKEWPVVWVELDGLGNATLIRSLCETLRIDRLSVKDIFNTSRAPKFEEYDNYLFLILKNAHATPAIELEHIVLLLVDNIVVSLQERPGAIFQEVRERIHACAGRIRHFGPDFLAYALVDAVVEGYYPALEALKKRLDNVEDVFITPSKAALSSQAIIHQIHDVKNDLLFLHSAIWPIYDVVVAFAHSEDTPFVTPTTAHHLRDTQDQAKQVKDLSEFYRLIASDLMNTTLAFSDNRANEIMKLLTMVATVFIPLSFIASLYGMNFDPAVSPYNMPELKTRYGYPVTLLVMLTIASGVLFMFWRRGWIGKRKMRAEQDTHELRL